VKDDRFLLLTFDTDGIKVTGSIKYMIRRLSLDWCMRLLDVIQQTLYICEDDLVSRDSIRPPTYEFKKKYPTVLRAKRMELGWIHTMEVSIALCLKTIL